MLFKEKKTKKNTLALLDPTAPFSCYKVTLTTHYLLQNNWKVCPGGSLVWSAVEKKNRDREDGSYTAAQERGMCCKEETE